jgi:hypothetical protein
MTPMTSPFMIEMANTRRLHFLLRPFSFAARGPQKKIHEGAMNRRSGPAAPLVSALRCFGQTKPGGRVSFPARLFLFEKPSN